MWVRIEGILYKGTTCTSADWGAKMKVQSVYQENSVTGQKLMTAMGHLETSKGRKNTGKRISKKAA